MYQSGAYAENIGIGPSCFVRLSCELPDKSPNSPAQFPERNHFFIDTTFFNLV